MKNRIINFWACFFMVFIFTSCSSQCNNAKAKEKFLKNITLLKNSIEDKDSNLKDIPQTIEEMESVTSIYSKSDGNFFGKLKPTKLDIDEWENWYIKNKDYLCWNEKESKMYLKK